MRFRPVPGGIEASPDAVETTVLRGCAQDLLALLGEEHDPAGDPLEALLGLPATEASLPEDPALARLLPDAYADDDTAASVEFRRYTEGDLRAGKRAHCATVLATLPSPGTLHLDSDQAQAWLGFLNDVRLVLGTRLQVTDDEPDDVEADEPDEADPRTQALQVYGWLGFLQESLLGCLLPPD